MKYYVIGSNYILFLYYSCLCNVSSCLVSIKYVKYFFFLARSLSFVDFFCIVCGSKCRLLESLFESYCIVVIFEGIINIGCSFYIFSVIVIILYRLKYYEINEMFFFVNGIRYLYIL